ncbi:putative bifunctional diguanylate cyclase/phosphodiesterase [Gallaecimonas mangrovi]|uniref:putative bifunctional diguanylate cyclase/phosphodiesterase n=1 Tax=Gallaecimonas mangrovi TaxID=2291597 RepID=UPI000E209CB3|nr:bifunctional diguanylate cyclase/phosphodiesterase [Gallaecimonas mangrovi]
MATFQPLSQIASGSAKKPFVSLYLKLLLVMIPVAVAMLVSLWAWHNNQQQQLQSVLEQQFQAGLIRQFNAELVVQRQNASQIVQAQLGQGAVSKERLLAVLPLFARDLHSQGVMLRHGQQMLVEQGEQGGWPHHNKTSSRLVCRERCFQQMLLPLKDGLALGLFLPLAPVIEKIHQSTGFGLMMLRPGKGESVWGMGVAETALGSDFTGLLTQVSATEPFASQRLEGNKILWWQPLHQLAAGGLLVAADISPFTTFATRQQHFLLWLASPVIFVLCLLLAWWVWLIVQRLNRHRQQLQLLANAPRQVSFSEAKWCRDEVDHLQFETFELAGQFQQVQTQMQSQLELLEYQLRFDELTGLANRHHLEEKIALLLSHSEGDILAVIFVDIQQFKAINDSLGYDKGDLLLKGIANRLQEVAGTCHCLGRFSGDKFVVVMRYREKERLRLLLQQLHWHLEPPLMLANSQCQISAVLGVAQVKDEQISAQELLRRADLALHHAKENNLSQSFFNDNMEDRLNSRIALERDLDNALKLQQFELYLQPKCHLSDGSSAGYEALVRWHHPTRGLVSPQAFIPQLENTDRIIELGYWIIEEALSILSRMQAREGKECRLAVNLACRQFLDASLPTFVEAALKRHHIESYQLEVEVTESSLVDHFQNAMSSLQALKALGVKIAIDDFGTGYSSLSYLHKLPFDVVKVDKSFTQELGKDSTIDQIVKSLISLVHNLGGEVVAEGIENTQQLQWLQQAGCDIGQGMLLGEPVSEAQLIRLQQNTVLLPWPAIVRQKKSPG